MRCLQLQALIYRLNVQQVTRWWINCIPWLLHYLINLFQHRNFNLTTCFNVTLMEHSSNFCHLSQMSDEWIFPENHDRISHLASRRQSLLPDDDSCHTSHLWLEANRESEHGQLAEETQVVLKDIFTFSSRPRSAPHGKTQNMSPEGCPFILDLKEDISMTRRDTESEDDFYGSDSSEEVHCLMSEVVLSTVVPLALISMKTS